MTVLHSRSFTSGSSSRKWELASFFRNESVLMFASFLQVGCEAVPHRATVYARVVESEQLWSWAQIQPIQVEECTLLPPAAVTRCAGAPSVCDVQLSQVTPSAFANLGPLCSMFRWSSRVLFIYLNLTCLICLCWTCGLIWTFFFLKNIFKKIFLQFTQY